MSKARENYQNDVFGNGEILARQLPESIFMYISELESENKLVKSMENGAQNMILELQNEKAKLEAEKAELVECLEQVKRRIGEFEYDISQNSFIEESLIEESLIDPILNKFKGDLVKDNVIICINKTCPYCKDKVDLIDLTNCSVSQLDDLIKGNCSDLITEDEIIT